MKKIHDKFVNASFSDSARAISFFEKFLPDSILGALELNTLQYVQESYLSEELREFFSDMVFEVKSKNKPDHSVDIVLLFEHKSSPEKYVLVQVGLYMFSHWLISIRRKKVLRPVIPVIYYQGKKRWKVKTMSSLFDEIPNELLHFIPDIRHVFIALRSLSENDIAAIRDKMMASAILAQKSAFDTLKLAEDLEKIWRLFPYQADEGNFLKTIFVYLIHVAEVPKEEWIKAIETIPAAFKNKIMTTYDWIKKEGEEIGIKKGKLEGKLEKETEVVLKGHDKGLSITMLANITNLSEAEVKKIITGHQKAKR